MGARRWLVGMAIIATTGSCSAPGSTGPSAGRHPTTLRTVATPTLHGLRLSAAERSLATRGLRLGDVTHHHSDARAGTVIGQSPQAGLYLKIGLPVNLVVSSGPSG
jgi:hypothetical protein